MVISIKITGIDVVKLVGLAIKPSRLLEDDCKSRCIYWKMFTFKKKSHGPILRYLWEGGIDFTNQRWETS